MSRYRHLMIDVPRIDYLHILAFFACVSFFVKGAQMEGRSALVWGGLSTGLWIVFTQFLIKGVVGGLLSQALLFAGLTGFALLRDVKS